MRNGLFLILVVCVGCSKPVPISPDTSGPEPATAEFVAKPRVIVIQQGHRMLVTQTDDSYEFKEGNRLAITLFKQDLANSGGEKPWVVLILRPGVLFGQAMQIKSAFEKAGYQKVVFADIKEILEREIVPEIIDLTMQPKLPTDDQWTIVFLKCSSEMPIKVILESAGKKSQISDHAALLLAVKNRQESVKKAARIKIRIRGDMGVWWFVRYSRELRDIGVAEVKAELMPVSEPFPG